MISIPKDITTIELSNSTRHIFENHFRKFTVPIFEQNSFYFHNYASRKGPISLLTGEYNNSVLLLDSSEKRVLYCPYIQSEQFLFALIKIIMDSGQREILFDIVNESQTHYLAEILEKSRFVESVTVDYRSKTEALYNVTTLTDLVGKNFERLRNVRNSLLNKNKLTFSELDSSNISDAESVLRYWNRTQGTKYEKNRLEKELYLLQKVIESPYSATEHKYIGYANNFPASLNVFYTHESDRNYAVNFILKGLNKIPETNNLASVSDATYLHLFSVLKSQNVSFVNDGELGEVGSSEHKRNTFHPIGYISSYKISCRVSNSH